MVLMSVNYSGTYSSQLSWSYKSANHSRVSLSRVGWLMVRNWESLRNLYTSCAPRVSFALLVVAFPHLGGFGEKVQPFIPCLCFKKKREKKEITEHILIPLFGPGSVHSGSAVWDDCGWVSDELGVSLFPDKFPHFACGIVSPVRLHWVKGVCVFRCNLPPALLAEWPGSFTCHCGSTGMKRNGLRISVSTQG